jgi:hypothetical protein
VLRDRPNAPYPSRRAAIQTSHGEVNPCGLAALEALGGERFLITRAPAGRMPCPARQRGATFVTRPLQVDDEASHGRHTDTPAPLGIPRLAARGQRRLGGLMDQTAPVRQRHLIAERPPAACAGSWGDVPGHTARPESLLDKGLTDAKERGHGAVRGEPLRTGPENRLLAVKGVGFHARVPNSALP